MPDPKCPAGVALTSTSSESVACRQPSTQEKGSTWVWETSRCLKFKTGVPVVPQKGLIPYKIFKKIDMLPFWRMRWRGLCWIDLQFSLSWWTRRRRRFYCFHHSVDTKKISRIRVHLWCVYIGAKAKSDVAWNEYMYIVFLVTYLYWIATKIKESFRFRFYSNVIGPLRSEYNSTKIHCSTTSTKLTAALLLNNL